MIGRRAVTALAVHDRFAWMHASDRLFRVPHGNEFDVKTKQLKVSRLKCCGLKQPYKEDEFCLLRIHITTLWVVCTEILEKWKLPMYWDLRNAIETIGHTA